MNVIYVNACLLANIFAINISMLACKYICEQAINMYVLLACKYICEQTINLYVLFACKYIMQTTHINCLLAAGPLDHWPNQYINACLLANIFASKQLICVACLQIYLQASN